MNRDTEFLPNLPVAKIPVTELNSLLTCELCYGYFFNAATITECLHTFCKSCLVRHIAISLLCPKCKVLIHPTDPLVNIRLDSTMQDVLYKLLPQVEQEELSRERQFYENEEKLTPSGADEKPSVSNGGGIECRRIVRRKKVSSVSSFGTAIVLEFAGGSLGIGCTEAIRAMLRRYLWVPRYTTVGRIQNYLHKKLNLDSGIQVCLFALTYLLNESLTLDSVCDAFFPDSATKPVTLHYAVLPKKNFLLDENNVNI